MDLAVQLIDEARKDDQRRLLVLSGTPEHTRQQADEVLEALDVPVTETTYVGPAESFQCETLGYDLTADLLGTTRTVVVLDCHERCEPNHLGQLVGTVDGGGLFVLLTPPLDDWSDVRDGFDETLAVPPFDVADVTGHFRDRLVQTLRQHRGIAIVDADSGSVERDGFVEYGPSAEAKGLGLPEACQFPRVAYEQCLTRDQVETLDALESLLEPGQAAVIEANRGRGKSAVAGFAAASLAAAGREVVVTGPRFRNVSTLLEHAADLIDALGTDCSARNGQPPRRISTDEGELRYVPAADVGTALEGIDCLFVDEAAALPVRTLAETLDAPSVAYVTTTHGYEGTGRGFAVRFRDHLLAGPHEVTDLQLSEPIRYAAGDPVEVWSFRALALDARPPVANVVTDTTPDSVSFRSLSSEELLADETLLREVFGLLVLAHYRTEPNDLMRLLDAPNVSVHGLFQDSHPVSVALLAREGGLASGTRAAMYEGSRIRGNMVPDVLTSQLRDESAGEPTGYRVMRIATHGDVRSRGLGSMLLDELAEQAAEADWLGVGYGATPDLVRFWRENGFAPVHLSTTRNRRSGEHSAIMLRPLSADGEYLLARHAEWFQRRLPGMLPDALRTVDADVIRALCQAMRSERPETAMTPPEVELTDWEWRHAASVADGPGIFETAPHAIRRLAFVALIDDDGPELSSRAERLLVQRVLQVRPREEVATALDFHSESNCMRALGDAVGELLDAYAPGWLDAERERFENSTRDPGD